MASAIPLPSIIPYWEHPGDRPRKISTWKKQIDLLIDLTNVNFPADKQLTDRHKNRLLLSHLGTEGFRRFEHHPKVAEIDTTSYTDFYKALETTFDQPTLQALAFFKLRTCKQEPAESATEFVNRLRTLQADCSYTGFSANIDLAYCLVQNCYNSDVQKRLLNTQPVDLDKYVSLMQAEENASSSAAVIRSSTSIATVKTQRQGTVPFQSRGTVPFRQQGAVPFQRWNRPATKPFKNDPSGKSFVSNNLCFGCSSSKHKYRSSECPAVNVQCTFCHNTGHFERCCLKKQRQAASASSPAARPRDNAPAAKLRHLTVATVQGTTAARTQFNCGITFTISNGSTATINACVDSGSEISAITYGQWQQLLGSVPLDPVAVQLLNFDGSAVTNVHGSFKAQASFQERTMPATIYVVDDSLTPIFGIDLITALGLLLDGASRTVKAIKSNSGATNLLAQFPALLQPGIGNFPGFEHSIVLNGDAQPVARSLRPVPIARRAVVEEEINAMVQDGIWEKVTQPTAWAHHLVTVPKPNGGVRLTTDLSPINRYVVPERHPLPKIHDLYLQLQGAKVFSKLDLRKGYFHISLAPESRPLTATITHKGLFQYRRLPMGLTDAASVFQRLVSQTLADCQGCCAYIDDILVYGSTHEEHDRNLVSVLKRLEEKQFRLNLDKCELSQTSIKFLGHIVSSDGIKPNPENVAAIRNFQQPTTIKQVESFLGSINYHREFLPDLACYMEPLQQLLRSSKPAGQLKWNQQCTDAFNKLKNMVADELKLGIFDPNCPTIVATDASDIGLGASLSQVQNGRMVPIAFASHTLQPRERAYATNEREALACVWACEHWSDYLLGRHFTLITDHNALTTILAQSGSGRKAQKFDRWRFRLSEFDYTVQYRPGPENTVPDVLSRLPQLSSAFAVPALTQCKVRTVTTTGFSLTRFSKATAKDTTLQRVSIYATSEWPRQQSLEPDVRPFYVLRNDIFVQDGCVYKSNGVLIVPAALRNDLLKAAHVGHPGMVRMKIKMRETYWWPGMSTAIEEFVRHCQGCQDSAKSAPRADFPDDPLPRAAVPWQRVAIDVTGPFSTAPYQHRFIVVLIDHYSNFPEILLTPTHDAPTVIKWLKDVFARYGNPDMLVSDNGPEFVSTEFTDFLVSRDIKHHRTPVYHPRANGQVEVFNRSLKFQAQAIANSRYPFSQGITEFLARFRTEAPAAGQSSPAELFFQRRLRSDFQFNPSIAEQSAGIPNTINTATDVSTPIQRPGPYKLEDQVRVRRPAATLRKGQSPFSEVLTVITVLGTYTYRLSDGQVYNARRMRRHYPMTTTYVPLNVPPDEPDEPAAPAAPPAPIQQLPRRSQRANKGRPPQRYAPT